MDALTKHSNLEYYIAELDDNGATGKVHYSPSAYTQGCRGALCKALKRHKYLYSKYKNDPDFGTQDGKNLIIQTGDIETALFVSRLLRVQNRELPPHLLWILDKMGIPAPAEGPSPGERLVSQVITYDNVYPLWLAEARSFRPTWRV